MNDELRNKIDSALLGLLKQANATLSVNKMLRVKGERKYLPLSDREIEIVYYRAVSENAPLIIGYHSGGWLFGGCALNDSMWLSIAQELDVNIASIGYAMAPKYKWRRSLDDSYESALYLLEHTKEFGFNREKVFLMGMSAGGNLAAAVSIMALKNNIMPFSGVLLLYPLLDLDKEPALKGPEHYGGVSAYIMNEQHVTPDETRLSLVSPAFAEDEELKGFPATLVFTAENDALKHEGKAFVKRLCVNGTKAREIELKGMSHCYFELGYRNKLTPFEIEFIGPKGVAAFENGEFPPAVNETIRIIKEEFEL